MNAAPKSIASSASAGLAHEEGRSYFEVTQFDIDGDIAFWTGFQHVTTESPDGEPVVTTLRITEVLRRQEDEWTLVHRHADPALQ